VNYRIVVVISFFQKIVQIKISYIRENIKPLPRPGKPAFWLEEFQGLRVKGNHLISANTSFC